MLVSRFSMRLASIDVARGVAASMVVAFHANGMVNSYFHQYPFHSWLRFGYAGVDFFFVLSGFVIYAAHANDLGVPNRSIRFAYRRFVRIFPTYWIVLTFLVAFYFAAPTFGKPHDREWDTIGKSFVLWPMTDLQNVLPVAWTLSHELLFYILFGFAILNKRVGISIFLLWQVTVIAWNVSGGGSNFLLNQTNLGFLIGVLAASLPYRRWINFVQVGILCFLTIGTIDAFSFAPDHDKLILMGYGLSSGLIVYGLRAQEYIDIKLPRIAVLIGEASYSIYLVHLPFLSAVASVFKRLPGVPAFIVIFVLISLSVGFGVLFHLLIERRMILTLNRGVPSNPLSKEVRAAAVG